MGRCPNTPKTVRLCLTLRQGACPLEPNSAGACAPAGVKIEYFGKKYRLWKGGLRFLIHKRFVYFIPVCNRKRMQCVCYNGVKGRNSPRRGVGDSVPKVFGSCRVRNSVLKVFRLLASAGAHAPAQPGSKGVTPLAGCWGRAPRSSGGVGGKAPKVLGSHPSLPQHDLASLQ